MRTACLKQAYICVQIEKKVWGWCDPIGKSNFPVHSASALCLAAYVIWISGVPTLWTFKSKDHSFVSVSLCVGQQHNVWDMVSQHICSSVSSAWLVVKWQLSSAAAAAACGEQCCPLSVSTGRTAASPRLLEKEVLSLNRSRVIKIDSSMSLY